jgi:hypothetical protein
MGIRGVGAFGPVLGTFSDFVRFWKNFAKFWPFPLFTQ